jgi:hypothetical protein
MIPEEVQKKKPERKYAQNINSGYLWSLYIAYKYQIFI